MLRTAPGLCAVGGYQTPEVSRSAVPRGDDEAALAAREGQGPRQITDSLRARIPSLIAFLCKSESGMPRRDLLRLRFCSIDLGFLIFAFAASVCVLPKKGF